jgi:hypothetical protein
MDRQVSAGATADVQIKKSVCLSCHGGCSTLMHVRDGELLKVEGDPEGPLNHGKTWNADHAKTGESSVDRVAVRFVCEEYQVCCGGKGENPRLSAALSCRVYSTASIRWPETVAPS